MALASNKSIKPAAMSRGDIVSEVAAKADLPQTKADQVVREYEAAIIRALVSGGEVRIQGFGTFKTSQRAARTGRNPHTGATLQVAARTVPRFTPSSALKEAIGGSKSGAKGGAKAGAAGAAKSSAKSAAPVAARGGAKASAPAAKASPAAKSAAPAAKSGAAGATKAAAKGGAKGGKK